MASGIEIAALIASIKNSVDQGVMHISEVQGRSGVYKYLHEELKSDLVEEYDQDFEILGGHGQTGNFFVNYGVDPAASSHNTSPFHVATKKRKSRMKQIEPNQSQKKVKFYNTQSSVRDVSCGQFWKVTRPFIIDVHNVPSDGHCGFRAVAAGLNKDKLCGWLSVREELILELETFKEEYSNIFGNEKDIIQTRDMLDCKKSPCPPECWFRLPAMGHLVASRYEVVLVCISQEGAQTFVPLRSLPSVGIEPKVIAIGHVDRVHFVSIELKLGRPIPQPVCVWTNRELAERWGELLRIRSDAFKEIVAQQSSDRGEENDEQIVIDICGSDSEIWP